MTVDSLQDGAGIAAVIIQVATAGGFGWLSWHLITKHIPKLIDDFRKDMAEARDAYREDVAADRESFRQTLEKIEDSHRRELEEHNRVAREMVALARKEGA